MPRGYHGIFSGPLFALAVKHTLKTAAGQDCFREVYILAMVDIAYFCITVLYF